MRLRQQRDSLFRICGINRKKMKVFHAFCLARMQKWRYIPLKVFGTQSRPRRMQPHAGLNTPLSGVFSSRCRRIRPFTAMAARTAGIVR